MYRRRPMQKNTEVFGNIKQLEIYYPRRWGVAACVLFYGFRIVSYPRRRGWCYPFQLAQCQQSIPFLTVMDPNLAFDRHGLACLFTVYRTAALAEIIKIDFPLPGADLFLSVRISGIISPIRGFCSQDIIRKKGKRKYEQKRNRRNSESA